MMTSSILNFFYILFICIVMIILIIIFHELGHIIMLLLFKIPFKIGWTLNLKQQSIDIKVKDNIKITKIDRLIILWSGIISGLIPYSVLFFVLLKNNLLTLKKILMFPILLFIYFKYNCNYDIKQIKEIFNVEGE